MSSKAAYMTIRSMASGSFRLDALMDLTMAEKRDLIERITELAKIDVLKKEDRDDIYRVCLVACDREMAKMRKEQ